MPTSHFVRPLAFCALQLVLLLILGRVYGTSWGTPYDLLFVAIASGAYLGVLLAERRWPREGPLSGFLGLGLGALAVSLAASLLFLVAFLQAGYTASVLGKHDVPSALRLGGEGAWRLWEQASETRALLLAWAPAFGLAFWSRRLGFPLRRQALAILAIGLVCARVGVIGFEGLPQVRWLVGSSYLSPWLGTWALIQPWVLAASLPLLGALGPELPELGAQEDLEHPGLAGAGEGGEAL